MKHRMSSRQTRRFLNLNEEASHIARDAVLEEITMQRRNLALQCRREDNWRKYGAKAWKRGERKHHVRPL